MFNLIHASIKDFSITKNHSRWGKIHTQMCAVKSFLAYTKKHWQIRGALSTLFVKTWLMTMF